MAFCRFRPEVSIVEERKAVNNHIEGGPEEPIQRRRALLAVRVTDLREQVKTNSMSVRKEWNAAISRRHVQYM